MMYCIAVIVDNSGKEIGYRMLDTNLIGKGATTKDISADAVLRSIANNTISVVNLGIKNNKVVGINGVLDRYTKVSQDNRPMTDPKMVILFRTDTGFIACDAFGSVASLSNDNALALNEKYPIANGKIVHKDGTKFISSIVGEYPYIQKKENKTEDKKIIFLSNDDTPTQLLEKFETRAKDRSIRVIGKLNFDNSSSLLGKLFMAHGLAEYLKDGLEKNLLSGVNFLKDVAIPDLAKICDKQAIIDYVKGIKEVTKDVKNADSAADLLISAVKQISAEKVKMEA